MNNLQYSQVGLQMTKAFEGLRTQSYQDVAGIWTIGYGHTGHNITRDMVITEATATQFLLSDLADAVLFINHAVLIKLNQNQFDALVDFTFNTGRQALRNSTLLRLLNAGNITGAALQFPLWIHAGGEVVTGLVRRRNAEQALFTKSE